MKFIFCFWDSSKCWNQYLISLDQCYVRFYFALVLSVFQSNNVQKWKIKKRANIVNVVSANLCQFPSQMSLMPHVQPFLFLSSNIPFDYALLLKNRSTTWCARDKRTVAFSSTVKVQTWWLLIIASVDHSLNPTATATRHKVTPHAKVVLNKNTYLILWMFKSYTYLKTVGGGVTRRRMLWDSLLPPPSPGFWPIQIVENYIFFPCFWFSNERHAKATWSNRWA